MHPRSILALLHGNRRYGGEMVDELAGRPGLDASAGTVYPLLTRLKTAGLVETEWQESPAGPPRKYYRLTGGGVAALAESTRAWRDLATALDGLLEGVR